ncbi:MAG: tRNA 2-thiouridine(34) synthase MnmA [Pseudomonadota bacterium]
MLNSLDLPGRPEDTRVVVAMSGGVDSSVVAGLLHREGYDVVGVTLQLYNHGEAVKRKGACCAGQDIHDARMVAERLGFPHYVLDYEERFRQAVIEPFAAAYEAGETPIPCVSCNQTVKFVDLLDTARKLGADALATGHYIRARQHGNKRTLLRPVDDSRDQSYFLFATTQEQIDYVRFPLGGKTKAETRVLAEELGIEVANKPDSQDICFVPQGKYSDVIAKLNPAALVVGDVVHMDGRVLGRHDGIVNFTIGQRRGIGVSAGDPIYVVHLDRKTNRVIVGPKEALGVQRIWLRDVNWLGDLPLAETPAEGLPIFVKVRSTRPPAEARLFVENGNAYVDLVAGDAGISPGQAAVFYEDDASDTRVLGGGWISRAEKDAEAEAAIASVLAQSEAA